MLVSVTGTDARSMSNPTARKHASARRMCSRSVTSRIRRAPIAVSSGTLSAWRFDACRVTPTPPRCWREGRRALREFDRFTRTAVHASGFAAREQDPVGAAGEEQIDGQHRAARRVEIRRAQLGDAATERNNHVRRAARVRLDQPANRKIRQRRILDGDVRNIGSEATPSTNATTAVTGRRGGANRASARHRD